MTGAAGRGLFRPVDAASVTVFRIAFGLIMVWEVVRFFRNGWVAEYYTDPSFHFTYAGFRWVRPWPGPLLPVHFGALGACAAAVALGWRPRLAAALFGFGFLYVFLLEKARYLNHFYLILILAGLLAVIPAPRGWSWRALSRRASLPAWGPALLRAQVGLVYVFAGVAKLNADWLMARPLDAWLFRRADHPTLGWLLGHPVAPWAFSYGGLLLDLAAWPLLAWRRTRTSAFLLLCAFHLTNSTLFGIGVFPWMMIAATTVFFEPDWPRRLLARLRPGSQDSPSDDVPPAGPGAVPAAANDAATAPAPALPGAGRRRAVVAFLVLHFTVQAALPLRHLLYPGSVHWTEEGHAFSWHMKLRGKDGRVTYRVHDPDTGETWIVDPAAELTSWQASKLGGRPDMILEYAWHLAERARAEGHGTVEVRADSLCSLNGHPARPLVDPAADLAAEPWTLEHSWWVTPSDT